MKGAYPSMTIIAPKEDAIAQKITANKMQHKQKSKNNDGKAQKTMGTSNVTIVSAWGD